MQSALKKNPPDACPRIYPGPQWLTVLSFILVSVTVLKIAITVFSAPLMGYANNWDFIRQSGCIGIWQYYDGKPKSAQHLEAPVNHLVYDGEKTREFCLKSSDNLFPYLVRKLHTRGDRIDFREIAAMKLLAFFSMFVPLLWIFRKTRALPLISIAFFLVFTDFYSLLYINTLYQEFSVIAACFLAVVAMACCLTYRTPPGPLPFAIICLSLLWLGLSKMQYLSLSLVLLVLFSIIFQIRWQKTRHSLVLLMMAILIPAIYFQANKSNITPLLGYANKTDTFLLAVLPAAQDRERALDILKLPKHCEAAIGHSWYTIPPMEEHPCPEVKDVSRLRLAALFVADPNTFFIPMKNGILAAPPFYHPRLGYIELPADASDVKYQILKKTSLSWHFNRIPANIFLIVSLLSFAFTLLLPLSLSKRHENYSHIAFLASIGGLISMYAIASSVFGDGYVDVPKHAVIFIMGAAFQLTAALLFCIRETDRNHPENDGFFPNHHESTSH